MDGSIKNSAFKFLEDRPTESCPNLPNEDTEVWFTQNVATVNSIDLLSHDNNSFGVDNILSANPAESPVCANLLRNMEEQSQSHIKVTVENNDEALIDNPVFSDFRMPQMARNSLTSERKMEAGVHPQNLGEAETLTSHLYDNAVYSEAALDFSYLFDDIPKPRVDRNTINNRGNANVKQHTLAGTTAVTDVACLHSLTTNVGNFVAPDSLFPTYQIPEIIRRNPIIRGNTVAGVQIQSQGGKGTGRSHVQGVNSDSDSDRRFTSLFNNQKSSQAERSSMYMGSNRAHIIRQNSQRGSAFGVSHVQGARSNSDTSTSVALHSPITRSSITIGGRAAANQSNIHKTETSISHDRGVIMDGITDRSTLALQDNLGGQQINRSPIGTDAGLASRIHANSHDAKMDGTNLGCNPHLLNGVHGSETDRNIFSDGSNIPRELQRQIREKLRFRTKDSWSNSTNRSNIANCPERIDNGFLNLGIRDNSTVDPPSNTFDGGISGNSGCPVTSQSSTFSKTQADLNFLSLEGNIGDQTWSNNAYTINSGTNVGVTSNPHTNHGGGMGNQTCSYNTNRLNLGANAGIISNPFTIPSTVQSNVHQYVPIPSGRNSGPGGNAAGIPVNRGFHGHSGVALRPFNNIPDVVPANAQAALSNLQRGPSSLIRNPYGPFPSPQQQVHMSNAGRISTNASMASPLNSNSARTFRQYQSGHPVPANNTIAEGAQGITNLADSIKQAQPDQGTTHIGRRGKRVPAEGLPYDRSSKVLLGPSVSGKPVPVAGHVTYARTYEGLPGVYQTGNIPNASTILRAPRGRKIPQPTVNPSTPVGSQTNVIHHLKWKDPTDCYQSSGENCQICKRDLTYTATGPVTQPAVPPPVAVLPCGHTFHDECLQLITPVDELKNPPCIPCAVGTF